MTGKSAGCENNNPPPAVAKAGGVRLQTRPVEPSDAAAIHDLLRTIFPSVIADQQRWLKRWCWQYWDNPFRNARPAGWVLTDGDAVLGHLGAVYLPWQAGAQTLTAVVGSDYAISPAAAARGGVFAALELAQLFFTAAGDLLPMATTANEKTAAVFTRFGCESVEWTQEMWRASTSLPQLVRSCYGGRSRIARRLLRSRCGRYLLSTAAVVHWLSRRMPALGVPRGCRVEITVPRLIGNLEHFRDQLCPPPTATAESWGIERTAQYLQWRYQQHPEQSNMRVITIRDPANRVVAACTVFHEPTERKNRCYLEEMFLPESRRELAIPLFCAALQTARTLGADHLITTTGLHRLRPLFWELGFESRSRSGPAVVVQTDASVINPPVSDRPSNKFEFWHAQMF